MFGRKASKVSPVAVAEVPAAPVVVKKKPVLEVKTIDTELDDLCYQEQEKMWANLGYLSPSLIEARLLRFLKQEEIKVYDNAAVYDFLSNKYYKWQWRPLRRQDILEGGNTEWYQPLFNEAAYPRSGDSPFVNPYSLPMPLSALQVAEKIAVAIPEVKLHVSDLEREPDTHPDPFLACFIPRITTIYIVAHWDEPGYKE